MNPHTGILVMMLALPCSLVAMGVGTLVGRRIKSRLALKIVGVLFVASALFGFGSLFYSRNLIIEWMYLQPWASVPMMTLAGLGFGMIDLRSRESMRSHSAKHLEAWQKRLEQDQAAGAAPLVLARDLEKIGDILSKDLGRGAEALPLYQQVYEILTREIGDHPDQIAFLDKYGALASKSGEPGRALELEARSKEVRAAWQRMWPKD